MAIKVSNTTVINDSRNLFNIQGASIDGSSSLTANSTSPALAITQSGNGPCLLVEDQPSVDISPIVITANKQVAVGFASAPQSTQFLVRDGNNLNVSIGLRNSAGPTNLVYGHTIGTEITTLRVRARTDAGFTQTKDSTPIVSVSTDGKVAVLRNSPQYPLDVNGSVLVRGQSETNALIIEPNKNQIDNHVISSVNTNSNNLRDLTITSSGVLMRSNIGNVLKGEALFDSNGNAEFSNCKLTAPAFIGNGFDWVKLSEISFSNTTNTVDINFDNSFTHYCLMLNNVTFNQSSALILSLYDSSQNSIGGSTYRTTGITYNSQRGFNIIRESATVWLPTNEFSERGSNNGGYSGKFLFFSPKATTRWKRFIFQSTQNLVIDNPLLLILQGGGSCQVSSEVPAAGVRFATFNNQNFFSGKIVLYGVR